MTNCSNRFLGNELCANQAAFTLAVMYVMDLILCFLDTFLWYVIGMPSFLLVGLSCWVYYQFGRLEDIYAQLPKKIYAELLATKDMEGKYKPKVEFIRNVMFAEYSPISRCLSFKSGMPSPSPCTVNTSLSTMSRHFSTIRLISASVDDVPSVLHGSNFLWQ